LTAPDFAQVTEDALDFALETGLERPGLRGRLLDLVPEMLARMRPPDFWRNLLLDQRRTGLPLVAGRFVRARFAANLRHFVNASQRVGAQTHRIALTRSGSLQDAFSQPSTNALRVAIRWQRRTDLVEDSLRKRDDFGVINGVGPRHLLPRALGDVGFELKFCRQKTYGSTALSTRSSRSYRGERGPGGEGGEIVTVR
jgi:hypothetical protein